MLCFVEPLWIFASKSLTVLSRAASKSVRSLASPAISPSTKLISAGCCCCSVAAVRRALCHGIYYDDIGCAANPLAGRWTVVFGGSR